MTVPWSGIVGMKIVREEVFKVNEMIELKMDWI
jgi:hypothetical protein